MKDAAFEPGARFGGYEILSRLGRGGVADVYKAVHIATGRVVALKVLHSCHATNAYIKEHMLAEAQLLSSLDHVNVVRVEDVGLENGVLWMAMEFLPGETLRALLRRCGHIEAATALYFAREVADGVAAAHEMQVIHRDLKPENIMITEDTQVKVLDMGAGKFYCWDIRSTHPGTIIGTPLYMSPEHIRGEPIDGRADVYSLGLILYEMIAGAHPFATGSESPLGKYEVCDRQLHVNPPPLSSVVEAIPKDVSDLVQRALEKDRAMRPSSMRELAKSIRELLKKILRVAPALRSLPLIQTAESAPLHEERPPDGSAGAATAESAEENPARADASPSAEAHDAGEAMGDEDLETLVMSRDVVSGSAEQGRQYTENHTEIMYSFMVPGYEAPSSAADATPAAPKAEGGSGAQPSASPLHGSRMAPVVRTDLWASGESKEAAMAFIALRRSRQIDRTLRMLLSSTCIALGLSLTYSFVVDPRRARAEIPEGMLDIGQAVSALQSEFIGGLEVPKGLADGKPRAPEPQAPETMPPERTPAPPKPKARPLQSAPDAPGKLAAAPSPKPRKEARNPLLDMISAPFAERERTQKGPGRGPEKPSGAGMKAKPEPTKRKHSPTGI